MTAKLYFDDPEKGLARETSHPAFIALAREEFYYDCGDDFSPFGSDDGSDTLASLEEWYQEQTQGEPGKAVNVLRFMQQHLADWDLPVPKNIWARADEAKTAWLAKDEMNLTYLQSVCRATVAVAFGQLKIAGHVAADVQTQALLALACQQWLNTFARKKYPDWEYADQDLARLHIMQSALKRVQNQIPPQAPAP